MPPRAATRAGVRDFADLADSLTSVAAALPSAERTAVDKAALMVVGEIRDRIRQASGGDMRLSGVGRSGAKVGAYYKMYGGNVNPQAWIKASGALPLIENDTPPHVILPRGGRRSAKGRRLRGKKALKFGGGFYSRAVHPGTRGKRPFARGVEAGAKKTGEVYQRVFAQEIRKAWGA